MTTAEAIAQADAMRANALPEELKLAWLARCEKSVRILTTGETPEAAALEARYGGDGNVLAVPEPFGDIYVFYLCAMVDFAQGNFTLYENDAARYNEAKNQYAAWLRRSRRARMGGEGGLLS